MNENTFFLLFVCLIFFGIGDILGVLTKAKVSAVFVSLLLFLVCFMTGIIPPDVIKQAGLTEIGYWGSIFIVFSMGTTINLKQLIGEWRTLVTAVLSMLVLGLAAFVMIPLIGYESTIVAIPILNGGIVATQIMTSAALAHGFQIAAALGTILFALQKFFGTPAASYFGLREARAMIEEYRRTGVKPAVTGRDDSADRKPTFYERHQRYYGAFMSLAITALFSWFAYRIEVATGLSSSIWALLLGALVSYLGLVPPNILEHANSSGVINVGVFAAIIPSLATIKAADLLHLSVSCVIVFALTFIVLGLFFWVLPLWKLMGSRNVAMGVACCQLIGFPATYLVVNEVAQAVGQNQEERQIILDNLMPKYLVAGFATVTSISIIIAGVFTNFL